MDSDNEALMDQCALECMQAIESKDKPKFISSLHVLIADLLSRMRSDEDSEPEPETKD